MRARTKPVKANGGNGGKGKSQGKGKADPCAAHRKAQNKYVAKNPAAQRKRVAETYKKKKPAILAQKKAARKANGGKAKKGGKVGRPRTGCKGSS